MKYNNDKVYQDSLLNILYKNAFSWQRLAEVFNPPTFIPHFNAMTFIPGVSNEILVKLGIIYMIAKKCLLLAEEKCTPMLDDEKIEVTILQQNIFVIVPSLTLVTTTHISAIGQELIKFIEKKFILNQQDELRFCPFNLQKINKFSQASDKSSLAEIVAYLKTIIVNNIKEYYPNFLPMLNENIKNSATKIAEHVAKIMASSNPLISSPPQRLDRSPPPTPDKGAKKSRRVIASPY